MVSRPAKPPYSSTTTAMWMRRACMSRSSTSTGLDSGTKEAGRMISSTRIRLVSWSPWVRRTRSLR